MTNGFLTALIVILLVILVGIIVLAIVWNSYINRASDSSTQITPLQPPVDFLYQCANFECGPGLECDSVSGVCKRSNGRLCNVSLDCLNGAYCSGVCFDLETNPPAFTTEEANDPCPCPSTMTCVTNVDGEGANLCKKNANISCQVDQECFSESCVDSVCSEGLPPGEPCTSDSQCAPGSSCSDNFCQEEGITTGQEGASCRSGSQPGCDTGFSCLNNVCTTATQGLVDSCSVDQPCSAPMVCRTSEYNICEPNNTNCVCSYPYTFDTILRPDPNSCLITGGCTDDYTCSSSSTCLGVKDTPCVIDLHCASGSCSLNGGIFQLQFLEIDPTTDQSTTSTDPLDLSGSLSVILKSLSSGFVPENIKRLTASTQTIDTIFYVVPGDSSNSDGTGVLDVQGNSVVSGYTNTTSTSGSTTTQTERTLIDAVSFPTNNILIAFNETVTTTVSGGQPSTQTNDTLYVYSSGSLTPFNPNTTQSGLPGTQYTNGTPLSVAWIDRSSSGDVLILDKNQSVYFKLLSQTSYSQLVVSTTGNPVTMAQRPQFYGSGSSSTSTPNVAYIANYTDSDGTNRGSVIQFTGDFLGSVYPVYNNTSDAYTVNDFSLYVNDTSEYMIFTATNKITLQTFLFSVPQVSNEPLPGYVSNQTRVLATSLGMYLSSQSRCS